MTAEGLLKRYRVLESEVAAARQKLTAKEREMKLFLLSVADVSMGDIVRLKDGKLGRVAGIDAGCVRPSSNGTFRKPWISVNPAKKNGEWADSIRNAYNYWEIVERAPVPAQDDGGSHG